MAVFEVTAREVDLALIGLLAGTLWVAAAALLYAARHPAEPPVGPRTLELGQEPPAVANLLVHDFRGTPEAVPATVIDLAARRVLDLEQRGPGVFYVRLRSKPPEARLTPYEKRVLEHLRRSASDGVVPAAALTTGRDDESGRWHRDFEAEVVADAKSRGLARDASEGWMLSALTVASVVPAVPALVASAWGIAVTVVVAELAIVGWIRARFPLRETPEGLEAAARWLGVRAELAENEVFVTYTPLTVPLWDRLLAYGAALGVATGASGPLPMGKESDTRAWSSYGGRWRPVRISYPRLWPPAWGAEPFVAMVGGLGATVAGGLALNWSGAELLAAVGDTGPASGRGSCSQARAWRCSSASRWRSWRSRIYGRRSR